MLCLSDRVLSAPSCPKTQVICLIKLLLIRRIQAVICPPISQKSSPSRNLKRLKAWATKQRKRELFLNLSTCYFAFRLPRWISQLANKKSIEKKLTITKMLLRNRRRRENASRSLRWTQISTRRSKSSRPNLPTFIRDFRLLRSDIKGLNSAF